MTVQNFRVIGDHSKSSKQTYPGIIFYENLKCSVLVFIAETSKI